MIPIKYRSNASVDIGIVAGQVYYYDAVFICCLLPVRRCTVYQIKGSGTKSQLYWAPLRRAGKEVLDPGCAANTSRRIRRYDYNSSDPNFERMFQDHRLIYTQKTWVNYKCKKGYLPDTRKIHLTKWPEITHLHVFC